MDDRNGGRTGEGSTPITPGASAILAASQDLEQTTFFGPIAFVTNGSRIGITGAASPLTPAALVHIRNEDASTCGLRVQSLWTGSAAAPYQNNDNSLWEIFNKVVSSSAKFSWGGSFPNAYNDIPADVHDSGERVGVYGWATSVNIPDQYEHKGRLSSQIGVRGRAGFQGISAQSPAGAQIDSAVGVLGEIRGDSADAVIVNAFAGRFVSADQESTILNNVAVYADAGGGVDNDWSFVGERGRLWNRQQAVFGAGYTSVQTSANISARGVNAIEFGNPNPAGYASTIGATASAGAPFVAFCAEAESPGDTFRTLGKLGALITTDLAGALVFSRITAASATGQTPSEMGRFTAAGQMQLQASPTAPGYEVSGLQVVGAQGAAVADAAVAAAAPTKAEFDALVTTVNTLLARLRAHGLIA